MIRIFVLFVHMVVVLFMNTLFSENVSSKMDVPETVEAGEEFEVNVTIEKGAISSFSRFQQKLPAGLKASSVNTDNAEFRFNDNKVKLIWLKLPSKPTISFSYNVKVDQRLKGDFKMSGSFDYIENNERRTLKMSPTRINIDPSTDIDPSLIVDINEFEEKIVPELGDKQPDQVTAIRQKPVKKDGGIVVNLLVHKKDRGKFAKIQEEIPSGYIAESINKKSGIFTFKDQTLKFLWMNLPPEDYFVVSYKLIPKPEHSVSENIRIDGSFSYIDGSETKSIPVTQKDVQLPEMSDEELENLLASLDDLPGESNEQDEDLFIDAEEQMAEEQQEEEKVDEDEKGSQELDDQLVEEDALESNEEEIERQGQQSIEQRYGKVNGDESDLLQPQSGVYYRVQLAAGHKPVDIDRYFKEYDLDKQVKRERHEGWYKYSVGSFDIYKAARDYRVHIWNTTSIDDAFVSAYNDGSRITVQEALMISNQKWYR
ncbi:MAG: hypothetical protein ACOC3T_02115 [Bacteroidota bacterium]